MTAIQGSSSHRWLSAHFTFEFSMAGDNFLLKKGIFGPMGQKDDNFLFWSTPEPTVTFLGLENHTSP